MRKYRRRITVHLMDDNVLHESFSMLAKLNLELLLDHRRTHIDRLLLALDYFVFDEHKLNDCHSKRIWIGDVQEFKIKNDRFSLLTKTPFISLKTTPLITTGELGSSVFSCSRRQPSCLKL